ncbi:MAG TPA: amino acid permease, partial [Chlamydiales bacterium]|nr:amino acid permease [Chlamydiales bacterium]
MNKPGLFLRKPIADAQDSPEEGEHHKLKRHLNAFHLITIGIGAIIGAGIFIITGQAAATYAGPAVILCFLIASLICFVAGLCYAELSSLIPISGGSYTYAYVALG